MIHLSETLKLVEVQGEAYDLEVKHQHLYYNTQPNKAHSIKLDFDAIILGLADADTIDFDCEPYLEKDPRPNEPMYYKFPPKHAIKGVDGDWVIAYSTTDKKEAFRALLNSKDARWVNPYGKTCPWIYDEDAGTDREHLATQWQAAQSKVNKKYVILEKI